ncbi:HTH domain-containing protein [Patescibacteria group bacterium]
MKNTQKKALNKADKETFQVILEKVLLDVPSRSQEIIKNRYGVIGEKPKTLEDIGREYKITRERVRQIIKEVFKKIKVKESEHLDNAGRKIEFTINQNHGIIREIDILNRLGGENVKEKNAIKFLLECLENIGVKDKDNELEKSYISPELNFEMWKEVVDSAKKVLEAENEAISNDDFYNKFTKNIDSVSKNKFFSFISVAQEIKKNNFGKWGLSHWSDITPRVAWQRAHVVLKETGKPLHFREIAELIDKHRLNKRKTHPQTIHNELIKNSQFVLVGRGVYALSEWGYKKGTVKDVLEEILKDNEKPMDRSEILSRISKIRQVKKSTILINLNNFFERVEKDKYTIKI